MRLAVYSSIANAPLLNLVAVQNEDLLLGCQRFWFILSSVTRTRLVFGSKFNGNKAAASLSRTDLPNPALRFARERLVEEEQSPQIMERFQLLLAR